MEAARSSETSVDKYFTQQCIPEDKSELHTRRRDYLKSHIRMSNYYLSLALWGLILLVKESNSSDGDKIMQN
jgi:hypothetical protein